MASGTRGHPPYVAVQFVFEMSFGNLGETCPLSQGAQARRNALRIRHKNGVEVRKKRLRGFKKKSRGFK
jgi:hypothetical protein